MNDHMNAMGIGDGNRQQETDIPAAARRGSAPSAQLPPIADWPIKAEPYDARPGKASKRKETIIGAFVVGAVVAASAVGWMLTEGELHAFLGVVFLIGLIGVAMIISQFRNLARIMRLPDDGLIITAPAILAAYGRHGLAEIRLATPCISYDSDDDEYTVRRQGFDGLWYDAEPAPGGRGGAGNATGSGIRSYALWWRDRDWPDLKRLKFDGDTVDDRPYGVDKPDGDDARRMAMFLRQGVDLRMWPCVLEVRGDRARLMFDPHAEPQDIGGRDPFIEDCFDHVYRLK